MDNINIQDNFLSEDELKNLQDILLGEDFPWFYSAFPEGNNYKSEADVLLSHYFYGLLKPSSDYFNILASLIEKINPYALIRIKANSYPCTSSIVEHEYHTDYQYDCLTSIFYANSNDGYTRFEEGSVIKSIANRFVTFPTQLSHLSTGCTNVKMRCNINFNYFG
tara:strand:- start:694 stop:1188 length:495 start_codon:yes stop_codon:yes gene_type:complete